MGEFLEHGTRESAEEKELREIYSIAVRITGEKPKQAPEKTLFDAMREYEIPDEDVEKRGEYMGRLIGRLQKARPEIYRQKRLGNINLERQIKQAGDSSLRPEVVRQDTEFPPPGSED